jgi:aminopeptidase N
MLRSDRSWAGVVFGLWAVCGLAVAANARQVATAQHMDPPRLLPSIVDERFECEECEHACAHTKQRRGLLLAGLNPDGTPMRPKLSPTGAPSDSPLEDPFLVNGVAPGDDNDLISNDLNIDINPSTGALGGYNIMTVKSLVPALTTFRFRLQNILPISAVTIGATNVAWTRIDNATVQVTLDRAYAVDEQFALRVDYSGFPQNNGFDSISFATQNGLPMAATLSETNFAYTWWPTKDNNYDKSTANLRYTVPSNMSVASNGSLISVTPAAGGKNTWHWRTNYQTATYLYSFAVTNYNRFSTSYNWGGGVMPMEFFIYPASDTTNNRNAWLATVQMLATFRDVFGLYPFINEKYGMYQFNFGGGMEHQTITGQGTFSESVTAHELGHQWWGDMITCAFWNDIWLNEGFATYSEALWLERKPGSSGTPALHSAMAARRPTSVTGTIYKAEPLDVANINLIFSTSSSYRKPAWVLHMLRRVVGDATFFNILAQWRANYEFKSATTVDFINTCEQVVGRDMDWFFQPWIYQPGVPTYQHAWQSQTINGNRYLAIFIRQNQSVSYPTYSMPIDVSATVGGVATPLRIWNNAREEHYLVPVANTVTAFSFDSTPWILATGNASTTFVQGPPKIVGLVPAPNATYQPAQVPSISIAFSRNVAMTAASVQLNNVTTGPVPFNFAYNASTFTATITPTAPLAGGAYTLVVSDTVRDVATNIFLDGETTDATNFLVQPTATLIPTGNGLAGGAATFGFSIVSPVCIGDANGDRTVNFSDITAVLASFGQSVTPGGPGDADQSGVVDFADITTVLANFGAVCP